MAELEVESVDEIPSPGPVDAPAFVLYGGKGGVGKTTMAAATGLASALEGTPTLVVSTDPAHSLADMFGYDVGPEPTQILEDTPLYGVELDPETAAAAGGFGPGADADGAASPFGAGLMADDGPIQTLLGDGAVPGADEALAMQQLLRSIEDDRFDRVVVDTAPTGHTLRLLELPDVLDTVMGRVLQWRDRLGGMMDGLAGFGGDDTNEEQAQMGLEEIGARLDRLRTVLRDPARSDFRIVAVPETLSVAESGRLLDRLEGFDINVGTVVVNRVMEDPTAVAGHAVGEAFAAPNPEECAFCRDRWEVQQAALQDAQELFGRRSVKRVPLLPTDVQGIDALRVVAACLE